MERWLQPFRRLRLFMSEPSRRAAVMSRIAPDAADASSSPIAESQSPALQSMCLAVELPMKGLGVAARRFKMTARLCLRRAHLDAAAALVRHVARSHVEDAMAELEGAMAVVAD